MEWLKYLQPLVYKVIFGFPKVNTVNFQSLYDQAMTDANDYMSTLRSIHKK